MPDAWALPERERGRMYIFWCEILCVCSVFIILTFILRYFFKTTVVLIIGRLCYYSWNVYFFTSFNIIITLLFCCSWNVLGAMKIFGRFFLILSYLWYPIKIFVWTMKKLAYVSQEITPFTRRIQGLSMFCFYSPLSPERIKLNKVANFLQKISSERSNNLQIILTSFTIQKKKDIGHEDCEIFKNKYIWPIYFHWILR